MRPTSLYADHPWTVRITHESLLNRQNHSWTTPGPSESLMDHSWTVRITHGYPLFLEASLHDSDIMVFDFENVVVAIVAIHLLVRRRGQDWAVDDDESHGFETGRCYRCCNCCNAPADTGTWARLDSP